jgi:divalent metal cation (Fe/Co/Zn/Cd) transporter
VNNALDTLLNVYSAISLVVIIGGAVGGLLLDLVRSWGHPKGGPAYVVKRLAAHVLYCLALLTGLIVLFYLAAVQPHGAEAVPGFAIAVAMLAWSLFCTLWLLRLSPRMTAQHPRVTAWPHRDDALLALALAASLAILLNWEQLRSSWGSAP